MNEAAKEVALQDNTTSSRGHLLKGIKAIPFLLSHIFRRGGVRVNGVSGKLLIRFGNVFVGGVLCVSKVVMMLSRYFFDIVGVGIVVKIKSKIVLMVSRELTSAFVGEIRCMLVLASQESNNRAFLPDITEPRLGSSSTQMFGRGTPGTQASMP